MSFKYKLITLFFVIATLLFSNFTFTGYMKADNAEINVDSSQEISQYHIDIIFRNFPNLKREALIYGGEISSPYQNDQILMVKYNSNSRYFINLHPSDYRSELFLDMAKNNMEPNFSIPDENYTYKELYDSKKNVGLFLFRFISDLNIIILVDF